MRLLLAIVGGLLLVQSVQAAVYQWTDSRGVEHFSDQSPQQIPLTVTITEPADGVTLRHNHEPLRVVVEVRPALRSKQRVQLLYDGTPVGAPQDTLVFELPIVYRGQHTLLARVVDREGQVLADSNLMTFYMHPPRVGMVPETKP